MELIIETIKDIGFPIAISLYLLYERDRTTKAMTQALKDLEILIKPKL